MTLKTSILSCEPGIKRDGTNFASRNWTDGVWTRFQRGVPRKIGGYKQIVSGLPDIPRKVFIYPNSPNLNIYIADFQSIKYIPIDQFGNVLGPLVDRTPELFISNLNNNFKFDSMFSTVSNSSVLIAHASQSLNSIDNTTETEIYYGDSTAITPLIPTGISVSGGIVVLHPILFMYGNSGDVKWSKPNDPTTILDEARPAASKIVAGMSTRGGNSSPAGLLWSLDSLIRVTNVGTTDLDFSFDTVSDESSILSSRCVIEYDSLYFWVGIDKFLVYNGTVQELPNNMSTNFFFDNINYAQRQKVWATKNTRFGEIWWFFPKGNVTECNWAVIYNIRENSWYDTPINRGDGYFTQIFTNPVWSDNEFAPYSIWMHEFGYDKVDIDGNRNIINQSISSNTISLAAFGPDNSFVGVDKDIYMYRFEPDFNQSGVVNLTLKTQKYANSNAVVSQQYPFTPETEKVDLRIQGRQISFNLESNELGGYFEMGQPLIIPKSGDDRP